MNRSCIAAFTGLLITALSAAPSLAQDFVVSPLGYTTYRLSLIHISEPTRRTPRSYAVF